MNIETPTRKRSPRVKAGITVDSTRARRIAVYLRDSVPDKHKVATERVLYKKLSPAQAIKQKCLACCNYSRDDVINCDVVICPLNPYRPYQDSAKTEEDAENE